MTFWDTLNDVVSGNPILIPRVLEVTKSQLCWVVGTVYMDMPLKPNVMVDIARDVSPTTTCRAQMLISN